MIQSYDDGLAQSANDHMEQEKETGSEQIVHVVNQFMFFTFSDSDIEIATNGLAQKIQGYFGDKKIEVFHNATHHILVMPDGQYFVSACVFFSFIKE